MRKYIDGRYRISNASKNWQKLSENILLKKRSNELFEVIHRIKKYISLNKLKNPFIDIDRKIFLNKLENDKRNGNILDKLYNIIPKRKNINKDILIRKYLLKWLEQTNKINGREKKMKNALNTLD